MNAAEIARLEQAKEHVRLHAEHRCDKEAFELVLTALEQSQAECAARGDAMDACEELALKFRLERDAVQAALAEADAMASRFNKDAELQSLMAANNALRARLEAARDLLAIVDKLGVRKLVAGWNGEGRTAGPHNERHPPRLGATLRTNCGTVYALDEAAERARAAIAEMEGK